LGEGGKCGVVGAYRALASELVGMRWIAGALTLHSGAYGEDEKWGWCREGKILMSTMRAEEKVKKDRRRKTYRTR